MSTFWSDLYAAGADVVLNGHDHDYERFAPQNATGSATTPTASASSSSARAARTTCRSRRDQANSEVRDRARFGFLELTLSDGGYSWKFVSDPPAGFSDSGTGTCH